MYNGFGMVTIRQNGQVGNTRHTFSRMINEFQLTPSNDVIYIYNDVYIQDKNDSEYISIEMNLLYFVYCLKQIT